MSTKLWSAPGNKRLTTEEMGKLQHLKAVNYDGYTSRNSGLTNKTSCPGCGSASTFQAGFMPRRQRWECRDCRHTWWDKAPLSLGEVG